MRRARSSATINTIRDEAEHSGDEARLRNLRFSLRISRSAAGFDNHTDNARFMIPVHRDTMPPSDNHRSPALTPQHFDTPPHLVGR